MIPAEAMIISLFRVLDGWQLLNTIIGLTLMYLASVLPFTIWTLRGFVDGVPVELEEAAMVDGCSRARRVLAGHVPAGRAGPGRHRRLRLHPGVERVHLRARAECPARERDAAGLAAVQRSRRGTDWGGVMAGSTLMAIPVIVFFLIVQRRMASGLTRGGEGMSAHEPRRCGNRAAPGHPHDPPARVRRAPRRPTGCCADSTTGLGGVGLFGHNIADRRAARRPHRAAARRRTRRRHRDRRGGRRRHPAALHDRGARTPATPPLGARRRRADPRGRPRHRRGARRARRQPQLRARRRRQLQPRQPGHRRPHLRRRRRPRRARTPPPGSRGLQQPGVAACAKHFPGHGDTAADSHLALPVVDVPLDDAARARAGAVPRPRSRPGAAPIMTAHIAAPAARPRPARHASRRASCTACCASELGFDGVIVTDALDMAGADGGAASPRPRCWRSPPVPTCSASAPTTRRRSSTRSWPPWPRPSDRVGCRRACARCRGAGRGLAGPPRRCRTPPPCASFRRRGAGTARLGSPAHSRSRMPRRPRLAAASGPGTLIRVEAGQHRGRRRALGTVRGGRSTRRRSEPTWPAIGTILELDEHARDPVPASLAGPVLVVGRDLHRPPFAVAAIDALRSARDHDVVVMGWPSAAREMLIVMFGARRWFGLCLLCLLVPIPQLASIVPRK